MEPGEGRKRVVLENLSPLTGGGRFPARGILGDQFPVEADIYAGGGETIRALLLYRHVSQEDWREIPMEPRGEDRRGASFRLTRLGGYRFTLEAWVDRFATWRSGLERLIRAGMETSLDILEGAEILQRAAEGAGEDEALKLSRLAAFLREAPGSPEAAEAALNPGLPKLIPPGPDRALATRLEDGYRVEVERPLARFGAWYQMFPRSAAREPGRHGTLSDCAGRLKYVADMGFDVVCLPPVHPIGRTGRRGQGGASPGRPGDVGDPCAVGYGSGGHKAVHPRLGDLDSFRYLVKKAESLGLEIALELAFQCSPDHPWVQEHPEWFHLRPDGNPARLATRLGFREDIVPFDFQTPAWRELWEELKGVVLFWVEQGVRAFRVANPHIQPFAFWEWLIDEVRRERPEVVFSAQAFTRPKVVERLSRLGFSQFADFFPWRNTKWELMEHFGGERDGQVQGRPRAALWLNTPDLLPGCLQQGGRAGFMIRLVLAATLGATYGIYGPAFELLEDKAEPGTEQYLHPERFQLRRWDLEVSGSLREFITQVNRIRRDNPAFFTGRPPVFHPVDSPGIIAYHRRSGDGENLVLTVVNLDPVHRAEGRLRLDMEALGLPPGKSFQALDLISGERFMWRGDPVDIPLDPAAQPARIFSLDRRVQSERDQEYYL